MAIYGINYKGLNKRKNYEQLFDYLQNNQDMVRYPDRFAKQMRNHPYLTQFDSEEFGYMGVQQKEIQKKDAETSTMREMASTATGPSTTDLIARQPPRPPPMGVGQHLNIMGGPQAGRRLVPQSYGDVEVPQPVNQQGSMLNNGGPRVGVGVAIRPRALGDDEVPLPVNQQQRMNGILVNGGPRVGVARRPRAQGDDEIDVPQDYAGSSSSSSSDAIGSVMRHHRMRERLEQLAEFYLMSDSSSSSSYSSSGFETIPENDFQSVTSALSEQALPQTGITNFTRLPELLAPHFHNLLTPGPGLERYLMQHEDELTRVMQIHDQEMSRSVLDNIYQRALQKISIVRQADQSLIDIGTERNEIDPGSESGSNKSEEMRKLIDVMLDEGDSASASASASGTQAEKMFTPKLDTFFKTFRFSRLDYSTLLKTIKKEDITDDIVNDHNNVSNIYSLIKIKKKDSVSSKITALYTLYSQIGDIPPTINKYTSDIPPKGYIPHDLNEPKPKAKPKANKYPTPQAKPKAKPKAKPIEI